MIFNIASGGVSYIDITAPAGASITATCGNITLRGSGSCTLEAITIGIWNISCFYDDETKTNSVSVVSFGQRYPITFTFFKASLAVTLTAEGNKTIKIKHRVSGTEYNSGTIAANVVYTFVIRESGVWDITGACNGRTVTDSVTITTNGSTNNVALEIFYATLRVTPRSIAGVSTVILNGVTRTNIASGSVASFTVYERTSYTVSVTSGGQTKTGSISSSDLAAGGIKGITLVVPYYAYNNGPIAAFSFRKTNGQKYEQSDNSGGSYYMWCKDGGMMYMWQTSAVNFTGYTTLHVRYKLHQNTSGNAYYTDLGIATGSYPGEYNDVASIHTMHWNSSVYADDNKWVTRTASFSYNGNAMFRCRCTGYNAEIYINQIWYT